MCLYIHVLNAGQCVDMLSTRNSWLCDIDSQYNTNTNYIGIIFSK